MLDDSFDRSNHTRWFWRDRRRAYNERTALELVTPALEDAYAGDGELNPPGIGFRNSCLRDEPGMNGTVIYRNRLRAAIQVNGGICAQNNFMCAAYHEICLVLNKK